MYCIKCGRKIEEGMKFCPDCGEPIDVEIYKKEKDEESSNIEDQKNTEVESSETHSENGNEQNQGINQDSNEGGVDKEIQKVRDEVARGAIKYVTTAEMNTLSGNLYLTNYNNIYFVSNGKRETYLLESKILDVSRTGRRITVVMIDGDEYIFDIQRDVDARSLVKKTKWSSHDDGVVYDDETYVEEDESEYEERKSKTHTKIAAIFIAVVIVGALCFQFGPSLFGKKESEDSTFSVTVHQELRCDECGIYESEAIGKIRFYLIQEIGEMGNHGKHVYLCPDCKEKYEREGVRFK
ncbi:MAG: zinc ribbon domain-containing protein [Eubacterium sp.]|nr:zinc ribbon domain-containing protein [Eubacterium sp.]